MASQRQTHFSILSITPRVLLSFSARREKQASTHMLTETLAFQKHARMAGFPHCPSAAPRLSLVIKRLGLVGRATVAVRPSLHGRMTTVARACDRAGTANKTKAGRAKLPPSCTPFSTERMKEYAILRGFPKIYCIKLPQSGIYPLFRD